MNNKPLFCLLFLISCALASAQENSWSLQKCLATALENSVEVKISGLKVLKSRKNYTHPVLGMVPTVGLSANHSYNFGSTIDPNTNNRVSSDIQWDNFYLNANVNLLDFGVFVEAAKDKTGIDLAKADKAVVEYEYKLRVLEKYFEALYAQELLRIVKEQLKNTTFNRERITKEVELGNKPKSDFYDIELAFSQDEKALLETQQLYEMQKLQLFQLMYVQDIDVAAVVLEAYFPDPKTETTGSGIFNPRIHYAELAHKSAKRDVRLLRSENLPRLSAFYGFSSFYSYPLNQPGVVTVDNFNTQFGNNKNHQAGLQLSIPVFNGFSKSRRIAASRIDVQVAKWNTEQEKIRVAQQIDAEKLRQNHYVQIRERLQNTVQFAQASFKTIQSKFTNGKVEAVVFTSVKNQLLASEYDLLKNDLQMQYTFVKINLLEGNEL